MDTSQWPQGIGVVKSMESSRPMIEKRAKPQKEQAVNCPRCNSTNTKFCYYNNYSLSQPRYFCKTCRRYWTEGGSLRNIPVGGGSRKNKRSSSSTPTSSTSKINDLTSPTNFLQPTSQNPKNQQGQDLNLAYPPNGDQLTFQNPSSSANHTSGNLSAMELMIKSGIQSRGLISFMPIPESADSNSNSNIYGGGFGLHEFKPSFNFCFDGFESSGYGGSSLQGGRVQETVGADGGARHLFPIEELKQVPNNNAEFVEHSSRSEQGDPIPTGYWNGMFGGGHW